MKDVKFDQLKAMLDYMYRGEVNISQDQLGSFLKAAESLQIKGLSDSTQNYNSHSKQKPSVESRTPHSSIPEDDATLRHDNTSPTPRRKKRRLPSGSGDEIIPEDTSSEQVPEISVPAPAKTSENSRLPNPPCSPPASPVDSRDDNVITSDEGPGPVPSRSLSVSTSLMYNKNESLRQQPLTLVDSEIYEPKSEFIELDDEDLTQDEDNMEAGPSHSASDGGGMSSIIYLFLRQLICSSILTRKG